MKRSPLIIIFTTVFIDLIGFGIVIPVLPIYAQDPRFAASPLTIGLMLAAFSFFQFLATPVLGQLSDRYGRRPVLFISLLGTSASFLLMGAANTLWMLFAARILDGITGGNISTAQAYIADITTPENRAKGMGMIGAAFGLGFVVGPGIGGILSKYGLQVPFYFAGALALANAILLYFRLPETVTPEHARESAQHRRPLFNMKPPNPAVGLVMAIYFVLIVAFTIFTSTISLYTNHASQFKYDAVHNGYVLTYVGIIGVIVQGGLIGRLVKMFGEPALSAFGLLFLALSLVLFPYASNLMQLLPLLAMIGIGNGLAMTSLTALASRYTEARQQGRVLGVTQSLGSLARIIAPIIGNFLLGHSLANAAVAGSKLETATVHGSLLATPYLVGAAICAVAFAMALYFYARRSETPHTQTSAYPPVG